MNFCQVFSFPSTGQLFSLVISNDDTVQTVKEKIQESEGISPDYVELFNKDKILENNGYVRDLNIPSNEPIDVHLTLEGGQDRVECCECLDPRGCCCLCECCGYYGFSK